MLCLQFMFPSNKGKFGNINIMYRLLIRMLNEKMKDIIQDKQDQIHSGLSPREKAIKNENI